MLQGRTRIELDSQQDVMETGSRVLADMGPMQVPEVLGEKSLRRLSAFGGFGLKGM